MNVNVNQSTPQSQLCRGFVLHANQGTHVWDFWPVLLDNFTQVKRESECEKGGWMDTWRDGV